MGGRVWLHHDYVHRVHRWRLRSAARPAQFLPGMEGEAMRITLTVVVEWAENESDTDPKRIPAIARATVRNYLQGGQLHSSGNDYNSFTLVSVDKCS